MLEAVPNVSEGRSQRVITAVAHAFSQHARLLDVHSDVDHHRSVYTLVADAEALEEAILAGAAEALERIDLRVHDGVHPRIGVVDVVPVVPLAPGDLEQAKSAARALAERIGSDLGVPVFLYGESGDSLRPAYFRRGGLEELSRRVREGGLIPDAGPRELDARVGATLVGARRPLVAYNVELETEDVGVARAIAAVVRETGGGIAGVQAIGLRLPRSGRIQVSMNVLDLERAPLHEVVGRVQAEAAAREVAVAGGELVGLVPSSVLAAAREAGFAIPGVDESRALESAL